MSKQKAVTKKQALDLTSKILLFWCAVAMALNLYVFFNDYVAERPPFGNTHPRQGN
jgi:hypothetical protein